MSPEILEITSIRRPMRGGSQSHLVQASDGQHYVAKFLDNPQGTRTLINEWIGSKLFDRFSICTPRCIALRLPPALRDRVQLHFSTPTKQIPVQPGVHFGSHCPVNPDEIAIFDFLPDKLLLQTVNLIDFGRAFVLDKMLGNTDSRQAIYFRGRVRGSNTVKMRAVLIDHGMLFNGDRWELQGYGGQLMFRQFIYCLPGMREIYEQMMEEVEALTLDDLLETIIDIPSCWFAHGDREALTELFSHILRERAFLRPRVMQDLLQLAMKLETGETDSGSKPVKLFGNLAPLAI